MKRIGPSNGSTSSAFRHALNRGTRVHVPHQMKIILERQDDLVVCKLKEGKWFWTACYRGTIPLIQRTMEKGEVLEVELQAEILKGEDMAIFKSNKTQIGVMAAWGIPLAGYLAHKFLPDVSTAGIHVGMLCAAAIVCAHILGYAITDGLVHFGKGKEK